MRILSESRAVAYLCILCLAGLSTVAGASPYSDLILADGPVGYWRLGEAAGTTANNEVAGGDNGVYLNGVALGQPGAIVGDADTAAGFNGSNQKTDIPFSAALHPASYSFECWANVTPGSGTGHRSPMTSRDDVPPVPRQQGYIFYAQGGRWQFWSGTGTGWDNLTASADGPVVEGQWAHLVGTYDGGTQDKRLYVNGKLVGSRSGVVYSANDSKPLRIGAGATEGGGNYWFRGDVDEPAVYGQVLSQRQVVDHYLKGLNPAAPQLLGYWALEETAAPGPCADVSGSGLHGQYGATNVNPNVSGPAGFGSASHFQNGGAVNLGQPTELTSLQNDFTIAAWINPEQVSGHNRFFARSRSGDNTGIGWGVSNGQMLFTTWGVKDYYSGAAVDIDPNEWTHVAVTMDANNTVYFYVDGELLSSVAGPGPARLGGDGDFLIGTDQYYAQHFDGLVDDVAIWQGAATSDVILAHMAGTLHGQFIPEPASLLLVSLAVAGLGGYVRRRRRA